MIIAIHLIVDRTSLTRCGVLASRQVSSWDETRVAAGVGPTSFSKFGVFRCQPASQFFFCFFVFLRKNSSFFVTSQCGLDSNIASVTSSRCTILQPIIRHRLLLSMANATSASDLSSLPSLATYLHAQKWSASIAVLLVSLLALFIKSTWQPAWPKGAPKLIRHWPIVGAVQLFGQRRTFFRETSNRSPTGHFSIYVGKHQVVGLTGLEARKTFFETKALNMSKG